MEKLGAYDMEWRKCRKLVPSIVVESKRIEEEL